MKFKVRRKLHKYRAEVEPTPINRSIKEIISITLKRKSITTKPKYTE
jgi:hypothetical protein